MPDSPVAHAPRTPRWAWVLPALAAACLYALTLGHAFPYDDELIIRDAKWLRDPGSVAELGNRNYFKSNEISWRPFATLTHWVEMQAVGAPPVPPRRWQTVQRRMPVPWAADLGDPPAWPFHATNLWLHACLAALVALLAARAMGWSGVGTADARVRGVAGLVAGGLMALHPVCVEAVSVISFREDLLAGCGMVGACWCLGPGAPRTWGWRIAGWCLAAVAIFSKESALLLPLWLAATEWVATRPGARRDRATLALAHGPVVGLALVYAALRFGPMRGPLEPVWGSLAPSFPYRVLLMPVVWIHHVRLLCFPLRLQADYALAPALSPLDWRVPVGCALAAGAAWATWIAWRAGWRAATVGALLIAVTVAPVSNLVAITNPLAERYLYVAVAGLALVVAEWTARRWVATSDRQLLWIAGAVAACVLGGRALARVPAWRDTDAVWSAAADTGSLRVFAHRARQAEEAEDYARLRRVAEEALAAIGDAPLGAVPTRWHWVRTRGVADRLLAEQHFRAAEQPGVSGAVRDAETHTAMTLLDSAEHWLRQAIAMKPLQYLAFEDLGHILRRRGDLAGAAEWYGKAATLGWPQCATALNNLAEVQALLGRHDAAQDAWRRALELDPGSFNICDAMARDLVAGAQLPPGELVRTNIGRRAAELWTQAATTNPWDVESRYNLGIANLLLGQPGPAVAWLRQALTLDPSRTDVAGALADGAEQIGDITLARQALEAWAAAAPDNPTPRQRLQRLRR